MRTSEVCPECPTYQNAKCIIYNGTYLPITDISPGDGLDVILGKIEVALAGLTTTTTTSSSSTTTTTTTVIT